MSVKEAAEIIGKELTQKLLEEIANYDPEGLDYQIQEASQVLFSTFNWANSLRPDFWPALANLWKEQELQEKAEHA